MKRVIIAGSPRAHGRSGHLAEMLFEACIDECPDDEATLVPVSEVEVYACNGCDACRFDPEHACVIEDDMEQIRALVAEADEVVIVAPVYFSGAPAPFKALLDRFQPAFWTWEKGGSRRPATLHVVGEGSGPHGFDALVSEVASALAVAGFRLERVVDWVGRISASGQIESEGVEYVPAGEKAAFARIDASDIEERHLAHHRAVREQAKARRAERKKERAKASGASGDARTGKGADAGAQSDAAAGARSRTDARPELRLSQTPARKRRSASKKRRS